MNAELKALLAKSLIVTGCDENHFDLATEMVASIRALPIPDLNLAFINFGSQPTPDFIASNVTKQAQIAGSQASQSGFKAARVGVKPKLRDLFPGYDRYLWIDGDCWVQNVNGVLAYFGAAGHADVAAHPEYDTHYVMHPTPHEWTIKAYSSLYPKDAEKLWRFPMYNGGVVSALATSPVWAKWDTALKDIAARHDAGEKIVFSDQVPLHRLIVGGSLTVFPMRAVNNWLVQAATPQIDPRRKKVVVPTMPFEEINIIHLAGPNKNRAVKLPFLAEPVPLRYGALQKALQQIPAQ